MWTTGQGPRQARLWISQVNAISQAVTGRGAVVTSWFREDDSAHRGGQAVDFRRLSEANQDYPQYTEADVLEIERRALDAGVPLTIVHQGKPTEHWHCGDIL